MKSGLAAAQLQSPCCGMNCLRTIQTQHRSPLLCFPSHYSQAGHFYLVPATSETLDSPGRAAATFQGVSTALWHHLQISVTLVTHTSLWPGTSTPSGSFRDCQTTKAGRQSSLLSIWDYYPLGNISIPYWKECHPFKNYLHRAIQKVAPSQITKKFWGKPKHFCWPTTLFHFKSAFRRWSPFRGWAIEQFHH